jgi:hypothetical protein
MGRGLPQCVPALPRVASARLWRTAKPGEGIRPALAGGVIAAVFEAAANPPQSATGGVLANKTADAAQP